MPFNYNENDIGTDPAALNQLGDDVFSGGGPFGDWRDQVSAEDVSDWTSKTTPERVLIAKAAQDAL